MRVHQPPVSLSDAEKCHTSSKLTSTQNRTVPQKSLRFCGYHANVAIPKECGLPPITCNIEGLKIHALNQGLFGSNDVPPEEQKWRAWLVHCLVKSARHYDKARDLVLAQIDPNKRRIGNKRQLPILDFPYEMEDCITSTHKAVICIDALAKGAPSLRPFLALLHGEKERLHSFRSQQEHMHLQIASGQTGKGPILIMISEDGHWLHFRALKMPATDIHNLIVALYGALAALFPTFDASSPPQNMAVTQLWADWITPTLG